MTIVDDNCNTCKDDYSNHANHNNHANYFMNQLDNTRKCAYLNQLSNIFNEMPKSINAKIIKTESDKDFVKRIDKEAQKCNFDNTIKKFDFDTRPRLTKISNYTDIVAL